MLTFCYSCRKYTPFNVAKKVIEIEINGKKMDVEERIAFCEKCNQEIFVREIEDDNYKSLDNDYRNINNVVTPNEIREIMHKYKITRKNLSLLLGLKETEIHDYLDGKIPSKNISSMLKDINYNSSSMMKMLEDFGENISNDDLKLIAEAVTSVNENIEYINDDKIEDVYFKILSLTPDITIAAAMKLIYYSYGFYYAIYNKRLFRNLPSAWINGPVYSKLYHKYKMNEYKPATTEIMLDKKFIHLEEKEEEVIEMVVDTFGVFSGATLSVMTKQEYPWLVTRGSLDSSEQSNEPIKDKDIKKYFNEVSLKFGILSPTDISRYCEFIYSRIKM